MKYMLIMRSTAEAADDFANVDFEAIINAMGRYNERMMQAGVLLDAAGLSDASEGAVLSFDTENPVVTDGPYGEVHELFNGFWMLEVPSKADAIEWARRAPLGRGARIEVRRLTDDNDFDGFPENEYLQKEKEWRIEQAERRLRSAKE